MSFFFQHVWSKCAKPIAVCYSAVTDNKISGPEKLGAEAKTSRQQCNIIQKRYNSIGNSQLALMAHLFRLIFLDCLAFGEMGARKIMPACQWLSLKALLNRVIGLQLWRHSKPS